MNNIMKAVMQYTIRPYDTIWMLAQVFNTTVESIMDLNPGINPTNLQIGQVISISPGYRYYPSRPEGRPLGTMPNGTIPNNGMMPNGSMPNGQRPVVPMPTVPTPTVPTPTMPTPNGQMPNGTMPNGTMPNGTMPNGQRPVVPMPTVPTPTVPTPTMPTPNGQMPNGTIPSMPTAGGTAPRGSMNSNQMNVPRVIEQVPSGQMPNDNMRNGINDWMNDDMDYMSFMDTYNYYRMLWSQHFFWTMYVIEAIIFDLPTLDAANERLLRNPIDLANALETYYGEQAANEFGNLFTEHVTIAGDVVSTAKAGDNNDYSNAQERWHNNADQIAAFLGSLNTNWSESDWNAMLYEHLDMLTSAISDLLSENYTEAINNYDDIELQIMEMGDMFIEGMLSEGM